MLYKVHAWAWVFFVLLFMDDAVVNLSCATWQWEAGYEEWNTSRIFHRWLRSESLILFPNPEVRKI